MSIDFAVWAPDEATFWASWVTAGIVTADVDDQGNPTGTHSFTPEYPGIYVSSQTEQGWAPTKTTGQTDVDGNPIMVVVPGWHANVKVTGIVARTMRAGIEPTNEDGSAKDIFDATWATVIFDLTYRDADPTTGFPAGYRNDTGVCYCDPADFKSPSNVWL